MKIAVIALVTLFFGTAVFPLSVTELGDGVYLIEGVAPDAPYAMAEDGPIIAVYAYDESPAGGIYRIDTEDLSCDKVYNAASVIEKLWVYRGDIYFTEHVNPSRTVFARVSEVNEVILGHIGYDYLPLFTQEKLFVCYEKRGEVFTGGYKVIELPKEDSLGNESTENDNEVLIESVLYAYSPTADPDGDGFYYTMETDKGFALFRYDIKDNLVEEPGVFGTPLGTAYNGRSLVIEKDGRLILINETTYESEGVAAGTPVAFFGGGSQVFLKGSSISVGNLYEGKSSRVDLDLGDFEDIYFYPISLKTIYVQIIRRDGNGEMYKIGTEKGGFEVSPVEGFGLLIDCKGRYAYFGG
jgi:hypothetical protein